MEKRKHPRLLPQENAFAAVRSRINEVGKIKVGKIKNISLGGLAFEYITDEELEHEPSQVDVFMSSEHQFHLAKVPCKIVYDIPVPRPLISHVFFSAFTSRQCGVQFEALTEDNRKKLNLFLETFTTGTAPRGDKE